MAAVTGNMELVPEGDAPLSGDALGATRTASGGFVLTGPRDFSTLHTGLARMHWTRNAVEYFLFRVRFRHEWDGKTLVLRITDSPYKVRGVPVMPKDAVPWDRATNDISRVSVWSESNSKMDCPVFDLPAGATAVGGTCPGANVGQSIVPEVVRQNPNVVRDGKLVVATPGTKRHEALRPGETICQSCYAEGGNYRYSDNQARMVLRYWWARAMVHRHFDEFVDVMVKSLLKLRYPSGAPEGILPVRLHSSGDFFDMKYAEAWLAIARAVSKEGEIGRRIRFWAPTRTWAMPGWSEFWREKLPGHSNFAVRASAYHFDDPAPGALAPDNAMGSSSCFITPEEVASRRTDFRATEQERAKYDWMCPTYAAGSSATKNCSSSPNPMGGVHCRACWVAPQLRVNYAAH